MSNTFGKYEILRRIGVGGMGMVYLARDTVLGRQVALKVLDTRLQEDGGTVTRFLHEAKVSAGLSHPNIVVVYDFGVHEGSSFIAMEYLPGENLRTYLDKKLPLSLVQRLDISLQIAKALEYAHRHGVVHRDVKPNNIQLLPSGDVKLMDFGIAKIESADLTKTGVTMGTPGYSSPEQVRGFAVSPASDVFSFGVVLYELFTLRKAFSGADMAALLFKIVFEEPPPFSPDDGDIPPLLQSIILKCIAKRPEDRYDSFTPIIGEMRRLLHSYSDDGYVGSGPMPILSELTPQRGGTPGSGEDKDYRETVAYVTPPSGVIGPKFNTEPPRQRSPFQTNPNVPTPGIPGVNDTSSRPKPIPRSERDRTGQRTSQTGARPKLVRPPSDTQAQQALAKSPTTEVQKLPELAEALPKGSTLRFLMMLLLAAVGMAASLLAATSVAFWLMDGNTPTETPTPVPSRPIGRNTPGARTPKEPPPPELMPPVVATPAVVLPSPLIADRTATPAVSPDASPLPGGTSTAVVPTETAMPTPPPATQTALVAHETPSPALPAASPSAAASQPVATTPQAVTPTETLVPATDTPTVKATPTQTKEVAPTRTLPPTKTPRPTSTKKPTLTPRPTLTPTQERKEIPPTPVPPTAVPTRPLPPAPPTDTPYPKMVVEGQGEQPRTKEETELQEMKAIKAVLDRYKAASEDMDINGIRDIWPSLGAKEIQAMEKAFEAYASQTIDIKLDKVVIDDTTANVRARVRRAIFPKVGKPVTDDRKVSITLRKEGSGWIIESFR